MPRRALSTARTGCFQAVTTGSSQRLLNSCGDAGHSSVGAVKRGRYHGMDSLALLDHHDFQIYEDPRSGNDTSCSRAIGVDVIGAGAGGPLDRGRHAIDDDVVHLGEIALSIVVAHDNATNREANAGCGEDQAFDSGSVIAMKGSIRATLVPVVGLR